jgi:hypothetical protein
VLQAELYAQRKAEQAEARRKARMKPVELPQFSFPVLEHDVALGGKPWAAFIPETKQISSELAAVKLRSELVEAAAAEETAAADSVPPPATDDGGGVEGGREPVLERTKDTPKAIQLPPGVFADEAREFSDSESDGDGDRSTDRSSDDDSAADAAEAPSAIVRREAPVLVTEPEELEELDLEDDLDVDEDDLEDELVQALMGGRVEGKAEGSDGDSDDSDSSVASAGEGPAPVVDSLFEEPKAPASDSYEVTEFELDEDFDYDAELPETSRFSPAEMEVLRRGREHVPLE